IELLRRGEITAEGFLDDDPGAGRTARLGQLLDDELEHRGRYGEVVRRALRGAEVLANARKRRGVSVVAVDVAQQAGQDLERTGIEPTVLVDAVAGAGAELLQRPSGLRDADDRDVEMTALGHRLQRRQALLEAEGT